MTGQSWEDMMRALRAEFMLDARARLGDMEQSLAALAAEPTDGAALQRLMRTFHAFSGSGGTHGFPRITEIGRAAEKECLDHIGDGKAPTAADLDRWRRRAAELQAELDSPTEPTPEPRATARPRPASFNPPEILLVDDDPKVLAILRRYVEQEGMRVRTAGTHAEALRSLESRMPDGLVVDIVLPDGSGYDLVERTRGMPGGDVPPVLVISVRSGFLDKVEATHCGADGYFEKPVDWETLMRRLVHLLDRNQPQGSRVLSVEDDPVQAAFLYTVLETAGYTVKVCDDPTRFESDLTSFRPDLVLMDVVLPGMTGYDLVKFIRQYERYAALPVIFLTTEAQMEAKIRGTAAGGDDYLAKPVTPALLLTSVAARIERSRLLGSLLSRDGLTRLLTHTAFLERARAAYARARRPRARPVIWVMLDLDRFKTINDRFGHPVGDRVLVGLAALFRRRLRPTDTVGRYGGEEFAILLEDLNLDEATQVLDRLREEFACMELKGAEGEVFHATLSAGLALLDPATMELDGWRDAADKALYTAKSTGRNRIVAAPLGEGR
jgi:diguanylate cyclase (GGDEF)-like protein